MHQPPGCGMLSGERLTLLVTERGALMWQKLANYIDFPLRQRMFMWYCLRFKRGYAFVSSQNTHTLSSWNPPPFPLQQYYILLNLTLTGVAEKHKFCSLHKKYQILDDQVFDSGPERQTAQLQNVWTVIGPTKPAFRWLARFLSPGSNRPENESHTFLLPYNITLQFLQFLLASWDSREY